MIGDVLGVSGVGWADHIPSSIFAVKGTVEQNKPWTDNRFESRENYGYLPMVDGSDGDHDQLGVYRPGPQVNTITTCPGSCLQL